MIARSLRIFPERTILTTLQGWILFAGTCANRTRRSHSSSISFSSPESLSTCQSPATSQLERIRKVLRPGGILIYTTPNLYRLRNLVFMALGHPIFHHFCYSDDGLALGHILEYSREHLQWQFKKAGFENGRVEYVELHHLPTNPLYPRPALLGYPLHLIPRWRDNLVATAYAPTRRGSGK
jgi:hypothetical protein